MRPEQVAIVAIVFATLAAVGVPVARAFARRIERGDSGPTPLTPDLADRLDRIERAVESVAIEVERISESQRFVTKLLSGRAESGQLPGSGFKS